MDCLELFRPRVPYIWPAELFHLAPQESDGLLEIGYGLPQNSGPLDPCERGQQQQPSSSVLLPKCSLLLPHFSRPELLSGHSPVPLYASCSAAQSKPCTTAHSRSMLLLNKNTIPPHTCSSTCCPAQALYHCVSTAPC